jgi:hypothetical protein
MTDSTKPGTVPLSRRPRRAAVGAARTMVRALLRDLPNWEDRLPALARRRRPSPSITNQGSMAPH